MKKYLVWTTLASASLLVGCGATGSVNDGVGYESLKPNSGTRTYIAVNDGEFFNAVARHNLQCSKDPGCEK